MCLRMLPSVSGSSELKPLHPLETDKSLLRTDRLGKVKKASLKWSSACRSLRNANCPGSGQVLSPLSASIEGGLA